MQIQPTPLSVEEKFLLQARLLDMAEQAIIAIDLTGRIVFWSRFAEKLYGWTTEEVQGRNIDEILSIPQLVEQDGGILRQLQRGETWSGEFLVQRRDGTTTTAPASVSLVQIEQQTLVSIVGTVPDSPERQQLEQRVSKRTAQLRAVIEQLKQSEKMNQTLFRISKKLNTTLDVETILDELAQEAIHLVNGESGFAGLRTAEGMSVHKYFQRGEAIPFDYTWPSGQGIPGWVLEHKVPYGTSDAANDPLIHRHLSINANVHSIICTPILDSAGEVLGYFDIRDKQGSEGFTISDQELLMAIAPVASIAIQNALAYQQRLATVAELKETSNQLEALNASLESAREEERTQIARELHDQLGQALTAMKFDLAWLTERLSQKDAGLAQKAENVKAQVDVIIKTVRRISTELRPGMLDDLGLAASIEWQARDFEKRTGIKCSVRVSMPAENLPLTRAQSVALFRIFQEALTNVARHANAKHIEVKLVATPEELTLRLHDDGRGIQAREIASRQSLGLLGMRERAKGLGGTFDIHAAPGGGTTVTVSMPISKTNTENSDAQNIIG